MTQIQIKSGTNSGEESSVRPGRIVSLINISYDNSYMPNDTRYCTLARLPSQARHLHSKIEHDFFRSSGDRDAAHLAVKALNDSSLAAARVGRAPNDLRGLTSALFEAFGRLHLEE